MHHHLFPTKDTYISNRNGFATKNFGVDELVQIGTTSEYVKSYQTTKPYSYINVVWDNYCTTDFTGIVTGSLNGIAVGTYGQINASASFSTSYFSGSVDQGTISEISGSVSGSVVGLITGSLITFDFTAYTGSVTSSIGRITGTVTGTDILNINWWDTVATKYVDRALIQFDVGFISSSLVEGTITNPQFKLNLKVCNEYELPIDYTIYAFPVSQSWDMGNGYASDNNGSNLGVSWLYTDYLSGSLWYSPLSSSTPRPVVDFINDYTKATASFGYGGGTWYNTKSLQAFTYEASDICLDVTETVLGWISGSIPNNGFVLMSSDEITSTGSGFILTFYSRDTNSINSPYLDVMWEDWSYASGSEGTGSVVITSSFSGMQITVQSGSSFTIEGGVQGEFSASSYLIERTHYVTSSNNFIASALINFTGNMSGSLTTISASVSGSVGGAAIFTASYFSGSVDGGIIYEASNAEISGSGISSIISGSLTTAILTGYSGIITSSLVSISGVISGVYLDTVYNFVGGFLSGTGNSGNIAGLPILGTFEGLKTINLINFTGSCGKMWRAYEVTASLISGVFSGSTFMSQYSGSKFEDAELTGAWTQAALLGSDVTIPLPSGIEPYAYATVVGTYVNGIALGIYQTTRSISNSASVAWDSASFSGQFIEGPLIGGYLNVQLSGSVYTSSYAYTSSVEITSSVLTALNSEKPFTIIVKNLKPTYKGGDVARINIFARKQFPLKTFGKTTQQTEYLVPEYLPTSSFYAIKDNESEEIIVDFDNYTRLSCEYPSGNFFYLDTTGLAQERQYRVLIRIQDDSSIYTFDNGDVFKITR